MLDRRLICSGIAAFLLCLLGPGAALATVKCQCNNGTIHQDLSADYDDADAEESCNDACSSAGGGRVWNVDTDSDNDGDDGDVVVHPRRIREDAPRRR